MRTRLEDLIATGDRQLAAKSYEAAIDTYRTALGEPGASEAGAEARLEAAFRARDAARGVVPSAEQEPAPPAVQPTAPEPPPTQAAAPPELAPPLTTPIEPGPAPTPPIDERPIEPPSFHLLEDDPSMLKRVQRPEYEAPSPLSILDPTPPPEEIDEFQMLRILITVLIVALICGAIFLASYRRHRTIQFVRPQGDATRIELKRSVPFAMDCGYNCGYRTSWNSLGMKRNANGYWASGE